MNDDLSHLSLLEIFRLESENQAAILTRGLLELEQLTGKTESGKPKAEPGNASAEKQKAVQGERWEGEKSEGQATGAPSHLPTPSPSHFSTGSAFPISTLPLAALLESLMRAAHSLKGAARIVGLDPAVRVAHALEDCFVAAQQGRLRLAPADIDLLFRGVDLLQHLGRLGGKAEKLKNGNAEISAFQEVRVSGFQETEIQGFLDLAREVVRSGGLLEEGRVTSRAEAREMVNPGKEVSSCKAEVPTQVSSFKIQDSSSPLETSHLKLETGGETSLETLPAGRVLQLSAENLNRLLGLAGESLVESRWLRSFIPQMAGLKRRHADLARRFHPLKAQLSTQVSGGQFQDSRFKGQGSSRELETSIFQLETLLSECRSFLDDRLDELDRFDRRSAQLSHRLYLEVLRTRMRPFSDGVRRFPRMVRDLAKALGKDVRLVIAGESTQVDRDILEKLETPLAHLLRNAVDHGCETPEVRRQNGKPPTATLRLEARHSAGLLLVVVSDDGAGVDANQVREKLKAEGRKRSAQSGKPRAESSPERPLADFHLAALSEAELLEFLFLPGFTLKDTVTEISGRGVGLDVVQNMVKSVRGSIRIASQPGRGTRFQLLLPLTLSVLRTLLVEIGGEPYALPLGQISRTLQLPRLRIEALEGRHHFRLETESIGLLAAHQIFECGTPDASAPSLPVVVLGDPARGGRHGLLVDRFLGERELVVQPLDPRLGKVKDVSAAALMEDGTPVLIVDVDDLLRSVEKLIAEGAVLRVRGGPAGDANRRRKRVLAVDDSLTVRELERKLLASQGYEADVAVDGMDGWNAVRAGNYDLVITDVDMPRMDGIELTRLIKKDPRLETLPVLIVSYKDRDEDRLRGLEAGADYYLTKSSFHDEKLLQAVADLIGEAEA